MNNDLMSHRKFWVFDGIQMYIDMPKKFAHREFIQWLESKNKSEQKAIRDSLRSFGWYIVKRRSGEYQLMERLTIKNAPEKFLQLILDEVKLCLENEIEYEVNLGFIEMTMPPEIVRVKNVPMNLNICVLMV